MPVILNPAPTTPFSAELLDLVDVLTPNETELDFMLSLFAGEAAGEQGLAWLARHVPLPGGHPGRAGLPHALRAAG